jgi:hypothetical protein
VLQLPEGDWFCSGQCTTIKAQLGALVRAGEMTLGGTKEHSWHVLRGFKHSAGRVSAGCRCTAAIVGSSDCARRHKCLLVLLLACVAAVCCRVNQACSCLFL